MSESGIGPIKPFNTIGWQEQSAVANAMNGPLSGFLAGRPRGGRLVCELEEKWAGTFGTKHAIACNSATSGLLAAAFAVGLKPGDQFLCPAMTMSATCAAPMFTGATPVFGDVDDITFNLSTKTLGGRDENIPIKAVFLTHLFGLSIDEGWWTGWAHQNGIKIVVDAAHSPFSTCDGVLAGTTADIGVYSTNVHKPLNSGEGGICVTNDDELADRIRKLINHGECSGGPIGLNLRMTEITAAIALAQLVKAQDIVAGRVAQAEAIIAAIGGGYDEVGCGWYENLSWVRAPYVHPDCKHSYYTIPFLVENNRAEFCAALRAEGVPIVEGYVPPLYRLPAFAQFARPCPVAEDLHDRRLLMIENCAWSFTDEQIKQIGDSFRKAAEMIEKW